MAKGSSSCAPIHRISLCRRFAIACRATGQSCDVIQSIRTLTRLHESHPEKRRGDFHFPTAAEVAARWSDDAIRATHDLAERCEFAFEFGRLRFPHYAPDDGSTPHEFLARLAHEGLRRRYGERAHTHEAQLREELSIIAEVGYEEYFLVVLGHPARVPAPRHRLDHARQRRRFARLLLRSASPASARSVSSCISGASSIASAWR